MWMATWAMGGRAGLAWRPAGRTAASIRAWRWRSQPAAAGTGAPGPAPPRPTTRPRCAAPAGAGPASDRLYRVALVHLHPHAGHLMSAADAKDLEVRGVALREDEEVIPGSVCGVPELLFLELLFLELLFLELGFLELPFLLPG